jgi:hypothetical protein
MTGYALGCPCAKVVFDVLPDATRLKTKRVTAEVNTFFIERLFSFCNMDADTACISEVNGESIRSRTYIPSSGNRVFLLRSFFDGMMNSSLKRRNGSCASSNSAYSLENALISSA